MPKLPQYKVFHIDMNLGADHIEARLESEVSPYLRVVAMVPVHSRQYAETDLYRVICEARD